jgi:RES domain-containing protein
MLVFRIALAKYSDILKASGIVARWNPVDVGIIYTASSRSLACLENIVNRDKQGLLQPFMLITINYPDGIKTQTIKLTNLPADWKDYDKINITQDIGEQWITENRSAILRIPSSIIEEEANYLINPKHEDFKRIKIVKTQPFIFDTRIKK